MIIGTTYTFRWYTGIGNNVLSISRNGGIDWTVLTTIAGSEDPNTILSYEWVVTEPESDNCIVRVVDDYDSQEIFGTTFKIQYRSDAVVKISKSSINIGIGF